MTEAQMREFEQWYEQEYHEPVDWKFSEFALHMHKAYARGLRAGLERAAGICAARAYDYGKPSFRFDEALDCATAIRAEIPK